MYLTVDSYGAFIHVKDAMFEIIIRSGEKEIKRLFSPKKITTLSLNQGASVSGSAVELALKNNIDIIFLDRFNDPVGRVWFSGLGSTTKIRKAQLFASVTEKGLFFVKSWLTHKTQNRIDFITKLKKHRPESKKNIDATLAQMDFYLQKFASVNGEKTADVSDDLRGLEGTQGRLYFQLLSELIPVEFKFDGRSFRPAKDHFNAFLNYSYGVLYGKIEKALIIAGIDPYLGFLHRDDYNMLSMVYDFVEPWRAYCEETVFKLFSQKKVAKKHADPVLNGMQLNKEGKALLIEELTKTFSETKFKHKNKNQTLDNIIRLEAHAFAAKLLNENFDYSEFKHLFSSEFTEEK